MPRTLLSLAEQFGGRPVSNGRYNFVLSDPRRIKALTECAGRIGVKLTTIDEKTVQAKHVVLLTAVYAS